MCTLSEEAWPKQVRCRRGAMARTWSRCTEIDARLQRSHIQKCEKHKCEGLLSDATLLVSCARWNARLPFVILFRLLFDFTKACSSHRREPGHTEIAERAVLCISFHLYTAAVLLSRQNKQKNDNYKAVHSRAWGFPAVCPWSLWIFLKKPSHRSSRWMSKITLNVRGLGLTHPFVWFLFLSGTPCLICGRGEEARTDAVCFTLATAAQRIGSWWMLHPRTSLNRNLIQTHTGVRPLLHSFAHCCD